MKIQLNPFQDTLINYTVTSKTVPVKLKLTYLSFFSKKHLEYTCSFLLCYYMVFLQQSNVHLILIYELHLEQWLF
jgi:hypothetical protein